MSQLELTQRLLCSEARVDSTRVRNGQLTEARLDEDRHAIGRLAEAPIWIDDNPNLTIMEIRAKARRLKSQVGDLGLIVVDYLQLMTGRSSAENRQVEVSEISRGLKILARELETPGASPSSSSPAASRCGPTSARCSPTSASRGSHRAGRRRRDVHLPRRGLRPEAARTRARPRSSWPSTATGPPASSGSPSSPQYTRFANMARGFD